MAVGYLLIINKLLILFFESVTEVLYVGDDFHISLNYLSCIAISWVWLDIDDIRVKTMLLIPHQNLLSNQRALDKSILCFSTLYFSFHFFLVFLVQLDLFLNCKQFISRKHSNLEFIVCLFHILQTFSLSCPIFTRLFPITILLSVSVLSLCMSFLILHVTSLRRLLTPSIMGINCP